MEDNAPAHNHRFLDEFWDKAAKLFDCIELLDVWPASSPDMNPIEKAQKYIQRKVSDRKGADRPKSMEEVAKAWKEEWEALPQETINGWIERAFEVILDRVIKNKGGNEFHD